MASVYSYMEMHSSCIHIFKRMRLIDLFNFQVYIFLSFNGY